MEAREAQEASNQEEWRDIPGYEGSYRVSDMGRVWSVPRKITRSNGWPQTFKGRILRTYTYPSGHLQVALRRDGGIRSHLVHRLVLLAFAGPPPALTEACHNDGNPANNRLDNLRWDTRSANKLDAVRHGVHHQTRKEKCPRGHDLYSGNFVRSKWKKGVRECLICARARGYARHHEIPESQHWAVFDHYLERLLLES